MKKIDAFGKIKIDNGPIIRARVIEVTPMFLAAFPESDPAAPILITLSGPYRVKGRILTASTIGDGVIEFQRASCGCQTPSSLRGPASTFIATIPEPAEA